LHLARSSARAREEVDRPFRISKVARFPFCKAWKSLIHHVSSPGCAGFFASLTRNKSQFFASASRISSRRRSVRAGDAAGGAPFFASASRISSSRISDRGGSGAGTGCDFFKLLIARTTRKRTRAMMRKLTAMVRKLPQPITAPASSPQRAPARSPTWTEG
jgi:hypothetical protein